MAMKIAWRFQHRSGTQAPDRNSSLTNSFKALVLLALVS